MRLFLFIFSILVAFYSVFVRATAWNLLMPQMFGLPHLTMIQAFVVGVVGSVFWRNSTVHVLFHLATKDLDTDERNYLDFIRIGNVLLSNTVELAFVWAISKLVL